MIAALEIAAPLWLMFNLFLFLALGQAGRLELSNNTIDRVRQAIRRH